MNKKVFLSVAFFLAPALVFAQVIYPNRGGTGTTTPPTIGQILVGQSDGTYGPQATSTLGVSGGSGGGSGTVTSVAVTVPSCLTVSGSPITTSGTIAIALVSGCVIPTTASTTEWATAYSWGDHGTQGYLTSYTETDPIWVASSSEYFRLADWFSTTTHALISYLPSLSIIESQISDLNHYTDSDIDGNESAFSGWDKNASDDWSTSSADTWESEQTARTADDLSDNSLEDIADVASMSQTGGDLLYWNGTNWSNLATTSLGVSWNNLADIPAGFADGVDDTAADGSGLGTTSPWTVGQIVEVANGGTVRSTSTIHYSLLDSAVILLSEIDTESELESILSDVTNVFTNNDGALSDDDFTDNTTSDLAEGSNLYYTLARVQTDLTGGYNAILGNSTSTNHVISNNFSFGGVTGSTWSPFCIAITGSADLCDGSDDGASQSGVGTTTTWTAGNLAYVVDNETLASVATGTLTTTATGLELNNTRALVGGSAILALTNGYEIPRTASTTEWSTAYSWGNHSTAGYLTDITGESLESLSDVASMSQSTGDVLFWNGTNWDRTSTSSWDTDTDTQLSQEQVEDYAGAMVTGNTETLITVTYQDGDGTLDFVVDNNLANYDNTTSGFYDSEGDLTALLDDNYEGELNNSAGLASALSDELGTGPAVFASSSAFTAPTLYSFFGTPCTGNEFLQDISDTGAFNCVEALSGGSGGSGAGWATTSDDVEVTYTSPSNPVYFGGTSSSSAEVIIDYRDSSITLASSSPNATGTIQSSNDTKSIRIMGDIADGIENIFSTVGDWIVNGIGSVTDFALNLNLHIASGKNILLGAVQWNVGDNIDGEVIANDTIDDDSIDLSVGAGLSGSDMPDEDLGDISVATGAWTLDTNSVSDNEIDYTTVTLNDLTFDVGSVSKTEYGYLDGVTSAIQTQLNTKLSTVSLTSNVTGILPQANGGTGTTTQLVWSRTIASTSPAFISGGIMPLTPRLDGGTISRIVCNVYGGTSKVIAIEDASANSSEDITCGTTTTTDDGSITNATYTALEQMYIDFGATTGAVDYVNISIYK